MIAVEDTGLVTVLTGSFDLELTLGDLASEDSTADESPSLFLVVADNQATVRALDALPEGESFPLTVSPGETRVLTMVLSDQNVLLGEGLDAVCGRGNLQVVGSLDESLSDRAITFSSAPFVPTGCP
jgi:hypothetical protein